MKANIKEPIFKEHFVFKENTAILLFYKTRTNMFLILSDTSNKCVFSCTSGIAKLGSNRKQKVAVPNV